MDRSLRTPRPFGPSRRSGGWRLLLLRLWALACLALGLGGVGFSQAQSTPTGPVYVVEIHGTIDLGVSPYLQRMLREAHDEGASAVVLDINTPGGRLDAALDMKDALLDSPVRTIAFVHREAYSAGALIAIATERIYMSPGAVMGAATPVTGTGETADEKIVSAVRSAFRSVAATRGLDPRIAEAMVDPRVEVPGLVDAETVLTLTTEEAIEWGYAASSVVDLPALLAAEGLENHEVVQTSPGLAEALVRFITNPIVATLLISLGFLGILFELQSPGFGLGGAVGLLALAAFFGGHLIAGLAGWEGITLVVIGVLLLALEMFVVPGFGIAGVLGIAAFLGGLYISLIGSLPTTEDYMQALWVIAASLVIMLTGGYLSLRFLPKRSVGGLVLNERLRRHGAEPVEGDVEIVVLAPGVLKGARGTALTDLHPSGAITIDGKRVDVVAEEGFIPAGTVVEVLIDEEYRKVVRAVPPEPGDTERRGRRRS